MKNGNFSSSFSVIGAACILSLAGAFAQTPNAQLAHPVAATAPTAVPALVSYSGLALGGDGKVLVGETSVTFLIYKDAQGGEPLFTETQAVAPDLTGHYRVQLGATFASGIPLDLFSSGEARWLEVQIAGESAQPRVLLASVPYALKAADATTLGGLPASAFALAGSRTANNAVSPAITPDLATNVTTTGGTAGYVPEFSGASTIVDSPVFINGANVGIGTTTPAATLDVVGTTFLSGSTSLYGSLEFTPLGTATASTGYSSQVMKIYSSAYNSSSKAVVNPRFEWQAVPTGNDTAKPSGTLNLLATSGTASATQTGFYFNTNGTINFAPGQTFPGADLTGSVNATSYDLGGALFATGSQATSNVFLGFAGNASATGFDNTASGFHALSSNTSSSYNTANGAYTLFSNTSGTDNTASGALALFGNTTGSDNTASGFFAMYQNTSGKENTAYGSQALELNTTGIGNIAGGYQALYSNTDGGFNIASGVQALYSNTTGNSNVASGGQALFNNTTGFENVATGLSALSSNTTGLQNTADGLQALVENTTGGDNLGSGALALSSNTTGSYNTGIGEYAGRTADFSDGTGSYNTAVGNEAAFGSGSLSNATAIGANAEVDVSNALVLGCVAGKNFCSAAVSVGIGTTTPDNLLTVNGSADKPGGGSWGTYSDGRLKNVNGSFGSGLDQVMRLHPIRYRYKPDNALGIRDSDEHIGVVAQEVQRVIPEAVTENSKGYLIVNNDPVLWSMVNAIKEQQRQIEQQQKLLVAQSSMLRTLQAQVRETRKTLRKVNAQTAAIQPTMIATK